MYVYVGCFTLMVIILTTRQLGIRLLILEKDFHQQINNAMNETIDDVKKGVDSFLKTPFNQMKTQVNELEKNIADLRKNVQNLEINIENLQRLNSYYLDMHKLGTGSSGEMNVCIRRQKMYPTNGLSCFVGTFCDEFISIETESIEHKIAECLPAFYNLKRVRQGGITDKIPDFLENLFVEELHLTSATELELDGIEKMPNLRTLTFENSKNVFLEYLFEYPHKIVRIYAINSPCLYVYRERLEDAGIEFIVLS